MVDGDGGGEEGLCGVEHAEPGAEDGDEAYLGGGDVFGCVVVAEGGRVLRIIRHTDQSK